MKLKNLAFISAAAIVASLPTASYASDGTITFNGSIASQTCTVNGNGSGSSNFTVSLPTVSKSSLSTAGQVAGRTAFNIALTGCSNSGTVHTYFEPGATTDAATGNLVLNSGGATSVEIGLLNSDFSPISAGFADASQKSLSTNISSGSATLSYYAQYVATGSAGPGAANSSVTYTLVYP